jgi:hypothetical protein
MLNLVRTSPTSDQLLIDRTSLAAEWLLDSGICRPGFGVAEEYRRNRREYASISKRATAYYVSSLIWLFETHGETHYIDRALTAAQFLYRSGTGARIMTFRDRVVSQNGTADDWLDESSVVIRALLRSWETSHHSEFLSAAMEYAASMRQVGGDCPLRAARAWLELGEITGDRQWHELYDRSLARSLDICFANSASGAALIDNCQFLEALLPSIVPPSHRSNEALFVFREVFARISDSLRKRYEAAGFDSAIPTEVCARLLRLRLCASAWNLINLDSDRAQQEVGFLTDMQATHYDPRARGGFYNGKRSGIIDTAVGLSATAVGVQALSYWRQFQTSGFRPDLRQLY